MKTAILFILAAFINLSAQEFVVEKVSGDVKLLKGISEKWENVNIGQTLNSEDLLLTENNSLVQLAKGG